MTKTKTVFQKEVEIATLISILFGKQSLNTSKCLKTVDPNRRAAGQRRQFKN